MKSCYKLLQIKNVQNVVYKKYSIVSKLIELRTTDEDELIHPKVKEIKDLIIYSDYLNENRLRYGYRQNKIILNKLKYNFMKEEIERNKREPVHSIALKYIADEQPSTVDLKTVEPPKEEKLKKPIHMPYATVNEFETVETKKFKHISSESLSPINEKYKLLYDKYLNNLKSKKKSLNIDNLNDVVMRLGDDHSSIPQCWMTDYEIYDDSLTGQHDFKYGTPEPNAEVSSVPCGGCGALLHCKDVALPGYLPSELFVNKSDNDLKSVTCQRCHFMKNYKTCLDVRVSANEYPRLIAQIQSNPKALAILMVDLTDFPCSIWPRLPDLIGIHTHVVVVGNKVDLLPPDSAVFLDHVKDCLRDSLIKTGIMRANIKHVGLISAKTGFGIENLINSLHNLWNYRGDVYLVGCANAGKSTLFNALLSSDFCKSQAVDLVQRSTTSPWPGTTLNLLKFPILKPSGRRLAQRVHRLVQERKTLHKEIFERFANYKETKNIEFLTLQSHIGHTFKKNHELGVVMQKHLGKPHANILTVESKKIGLDENSYDYKNSRWCYDTPGAIQPDQILQFLTTDELFLTLPHKIISPRTFCLWAGQSIFIAGMARLDILSATHFLRCTVFSNDYLPITICKEEHANKVYCELLQTGAFRVPIEDPDRLKMWPKLQFKNLETVGVGRKESVSDVVLSNAGWIAVAAEENDKIAMRAWTPEGRGIYLRTPALLPYSVNFRGERRVGTPAYKAGAQAYCPKHLK